jgi:hypothetical protein
MSKHGVGGGCIGDRQAGAGDLGIQPWRCNGRRWACQQQGLMNLALSRALHSAHSVRQAEESSSRRGSNVHLIQDPRSFRPTLFGIEIALNVGKRQVERVGSVPSLKALGPICTLELELGPEGAIEEPGSSRAQHL